MAVIEETLVRMAIDCECLLLLVTSTITTGEPMTEKESAYITKRLDLEHIPLDTRLQELTRDQLRQSLINHLRWALQQLGG